MVENENTGEWTFGTEAELLLGHLHAMLEYLGLSPDSALHSTFC